MSVGDRAAPVKSDAMRTLLNRSPSQALRLAASATTVLNRIHAMQLSPESVE